MFPPIPRDAAVGFTKALPLPRHPVQPAAPCDRRTFATAGLTSAKTKQPNLPVHSLYFIFLFFSSFFLSFFLHCAKSSRHVSCICYNTTMVIRSIKSSEAPKIRAVATFIKFGIYVTVQDFERLPLYCCSRRVNC